MAGPGLHLPQADRMRMFLVLPIHYGNRCGGAPGVVLRTGEQSCGECGTVAAGKVPSRAHAQAPSPSAPRTRGDCPGRTGICLQS